MTRPAIVFLTPSAADTARRIVRALPDAQTHGLAGRGLKTEVVFTAASDHLRHLFAQGRPIIGVCAAGILIRALAPVLADKRDEPPVLAIAEDGSAVVPLLGGHHGGNDLALRLAEVLGTKAAITTAGDIALGVALDVPPAGIRLANPQDAKAFTARLLAGEPVRLAGDAPWLAKARLEVSGSAALEIYSGVENQTGGGDRLIYHPAKLALGVGCERGCEFEELAELVAKTLDEAGLSPLAVALVATLDLKEDEDAIEQLAAGLGVEMRVFTAARLEAEAARLKTPSETVFREVGCHGVAEGAALAAAGADARLIIAKTKSARATCAVALAPDVIDPVAVGRKRGHLAVVGLGPGALEWRTPEAGQLLAAATDLVGYGYYLDLVGGIGPGQRRHDFSLGEETDRVVHALKLAATGRNVALVCSGDPGIYAMAALVFEQIEQCTDPVWRRLAVTVAPGISALQAAAARAGAPLGHDFCAISLSDLLTPRPVIEMRLEAAARGDFVVAFYNPASERRRTLLPLARKVFLAHRPATTPVILGRQLGRADETVSVTTLERFDPETVDMMTLVIFGATSTRAMPLRRGGLARVYTPRGYGLPVGEPAKPGAET